MEIGWCCEPPLLHTQWTSGDIAMETYNDLPRWQLQTLAPSPQVANVGNTTTQQILNFISQWRAQVMRVSATRNPVAGWRPRVDSESLIAFPVLIPSCLSCRSRMRAKSMYVYKTWVYIYLQTGTHTQTHITTCALCRRRIEWRRPSRCRASNP